VSLADLQRRIRDVVVDGSDALADIVLTAGRGDARRRLANHHRHYESSLVTGLLRRFPATGWLLGSAALIDAAQGFARRHPPTAPCMAEYGETFSDWLASGPAAARVPYLREFAELDWHLGRVSVEVDAPPISFDVLAPLSGDAVADSVLHLQGGVHLLHSAWPIDELMTLYVTDSAPDRLSLSPAEVWLEVRGARGQFTFARLTEADFLFRRSVKDGRPLGNAAERAMERDPSFDPGRALAALFAAGLVTALTPGAVEHSVDH
jgi:hypothetical protein